mgnify:CR=1 FL=1
MPIRRTNIRDYAVGDQARFTKTITETDTALFSAIYTGIDASLTAMAMTASGMSGVLALVAAFFATGQLDTITRAATP